MRRVRGRGARAGRAGRRGSHRVPAHAGNCGQEVTVESAPARVVSLDQDSTEILLSLGLEDRIVGTASWTDPVLDSLAEANEGVPRLADNAPTYEVLLGADPDFVTASFGRHYNTEGGVVSRERLGETVSARISRRRTATTAGASTAVPPARRRSPSTRCIRRSRSWRRSSTSRTVESAWSQT